MAYKYAYQGSLDGAAKAVITNAQISSKTGAMIAQFIRNKTVERAITELEAVLKKTEAVPFTRYTEGAGHKRKIGPGKYPVKATQIFLDALNSVSANAQDKGLGNNLRIVGCVAQQANGGYSHGRHRGRSKKSTHVEIVVKEDTL
jgi:large subunit ribosomal protein L22